MPVAAVHKYSQFHAGEEDIDGNLDARGSQHSPKAKAKPVEFRPQLQFGTGVYLPIGLHHRSHICGR